MIMKKVKISKLDAVKRQLETAIQLYFNYGDAVSIHTLACAAYEILLDLNKKHGGIPMLMDGFLIRDEKKREFKKIIREPQNFFKHADWNPEGVIDFNPEVSPFFIYDAISKYQEMTGEVTAYFRIFRGWYCAMHIDQFYFDKKQKELMQNTMKKYGDDRMAYYKDMLDVSSDLH
jgi:hypothetical protein